MEKNSGIYVAGHLGLVGSAITATLLKLGYTSLLLKTREELDLTDQKEVDLFFQDSKPEYVVLAAAKVGGIIANNTYRADFIYENLMVQSNIIHSAFKYGIKKLLFLGSTCVYPKNALQPLEEKFLLDSPLEYTNEPYAIAKISGLKMCESYNIQYGTNFISVMPTNLYGPYDNYDFEKSHVLPALLRKFYIGKCLENSDWDSIRKDLLKRPIGKISHLSEIEDILITLQSLGIKYYSDTGKVKIIIWGTGSPLREFMYSQDMADACVFIMENIDLALLKNAHLRKNPDTKNPPHFLNIGTGEEISIKELAYKISKITGFNGDIEFDNSKPDGTPRKVTDTTILRSLGYTPKMDLDTGLRAVFAHYIK